MRMIIAGSNESLLRVVTRLRSLLLSCLTLAVVLAGCDAPPGGGGTRSPFVGHWVLDPVNSDLRPTKDENFLAISAILGTVQTGGVWRGEMECDIHSDRTFSMIWTARVAIDGRESFSTFGNYTSGTITEAHVNNLPTPLAGFWLTNPQAGGGYFGAFHTLSWMLPGDVKIGRIFWKNPTFSGNTMTCDFESESFLVGKAVFIRRGPPNHNDFAPFTFFKDNAGKKIDPISIENELRQHPSKSTIDRLIEYQCNLFDRKLSPQVDFKSLDALTEWERAFCSDDGQNDASAPAIQTPPPAAPAPVAPPTPSPATSAPPPSVAANSLPISGAGIGWLGIVMSDTPRGIIVARVVSPGPSLMYLHEGDAIRSIDGIRVSKSDDLRAVLRNRHEGDLVRLMIVRPIGLEETITIALGRRPQP